MPCQHKLEDRPPSHARPVSSRTPSGELPIDGHAFSTLEKLRVSVGEEMLKDTSSLLAHYDDENTECSSEEDDTDSIR